ncbi:hypothetical protein O181_060430 [Austropuccinia psidii MF-1]|uniref:Uncharacterized protein n=1 Tax=Austropuccinia psidii MF-1 TaxID=1389203 RepID=A0A9Q3EKG9_9BASI|nr:hypothetical protein [Austropuccinia psidii MF-1]
MVTMNNVLKPLVNELIELNKTIRIQTYQEPEGQNVRVKLQALLGDVVATHKVAGFTSHSRCKFCSWCEVVKADIAKMEIRNPQDENSTKELSMRWHDEQQKTQQKLLVRKMGLRWSELNQLSYWDAVRCVVLGILHNWYEGVLQHHFRSWWGINGLQENVLKGLTDTETTDASKETESYKTLISTRGILSNETKK